jgi:hypothetical protein
MHHPLFYECANWQDGFVDTFILSRREKEIPGKDLVRGTKFLKEVVRTTPTQTLHHAGAQDPSSIPAG